MTKESSHGAANSTDYLPESSFVEERRFLLFDRGETLSFVFEMKRRGLFLICALWAILLSCCSQGRRFSTGPSERIISLSASMDAYELPSESRSQGTHNDPVIKRLLLEARVAAQEQELVFDGRRSSEGIVVVGRRHEAGTLMLALQFYRVPDGRYAFEHFTKSSASGMSAMSRLEKKFLSSVKQTFQ